jgi:hypothetical protein
MIGWLNSTASAYIAKLPELLRGGRPTTHKTSAACFIVRDHALAETIRPHHTNTAIGQFTVKEEDQRTGKPVNRRVAVIAISVWYEEPAETG